YFYSQCFYFFFQAEDGIRYFHVTGAQTCALPISRGRACPRPPRLFFARAEVEDTPGLEQLHESGMRQVFQPLLELIARLLGRSRSEERREGEDGQSRQRRARAKNEGRRDVRD